MQKNLFFFFSSRRRHTRCYRDWSSDVCSSDLLCGACTVHQNGEAIRSCTTAMKDVGGAEITTIEGIAPMHPVQKAWMEVKVPQCGYCQTGQIMQAIAMLKVNKNPTDQDIDTVMSGNLCRCGTYSRIRAAIQQAAKETA